MTTKPPDHEADLIKSAELLMRVIPEEARLEIMRGYCADCGHYNDECACLTSRNWAGWITKTKQR